MTDNEQKAHDLAIATIPIYLQQVKTESIKNESEKEIKFDVFAVYIVGYKALLECFENEFPTTA